MPHITEKLQKLLVGFDVAMLVTQTSDGSLRSRPMALAEVESDGTLWFLTQRDSHKLAEIAVDHQVNVAMQSASRFVSLSGVIAPVEDRTKVTALWTESWRIWFPGGKDDPNLILLRFEGESGEYWDNSGLSGIKYLIKAGKALLTGTRPDVDHDPSVHGKVKL